MVTDLVCGMEIDEKSEYKGHTYYFCGAMCKLEFDENPEKYISEAHDVLDK
jgi:YHS domain-containing protein